MLSIIICTYNPSPAIFERCLEHLHIACSCINSYEILIIDNNSSFPISSLTGVQNFLSKHPYTKIYVENEQGLTPARLRGIKEASGNLIVFIDDDNYVKENFFEKGIAIASANQHIGAWSGQVKLIFEEKPEPWTRKYWGLLVYREFNNDRWSNLPHLPDTMPCGAGLFLRHEVGAYYLSLHHKGKRNVQLDRKGKALLSGGDNDLAACACDIGLGVGLFHELMLDHYIPKDRLKKSYLLKLAEGIAASAIIFRSFRGEIPPAGNLKNKVANFFRILLKNRIDRQFYKAVLKGETSGRNVLLNSKL